LCIVGTWWAGGRMAFEEGFAVGWWGIGERGGGRAGGEGVALSEEVGGLGVEVCSLGFESDEFEVQFLFWGDDGGFA
ncbi:UNVERIFIED_CONTAM: hypothetical protein NY603_30540, partial [Bacteroidetes bacterium 56_B9]